MTLHNVVDKNARDAIPAGSRAVGDFARLRDDSVFRLTGGIENKHWEKHTFTEDTRVIVASIDERDALPSIYARDGVRAFVQSNGMEYIHLGGTWLVHYFGVHDDTLRTLYVDPVNGDDEGTGEEDDPVQSVQLAVYKLIPPHKGAPYWAEGEDRQVFVVANGTPITLSERIVVPPHAGLGCLSITGEEETLYSGLVQSGGAAAVSGAYAQRTITFTTSTMVAASLDRVAFLKEVTQIGPPTSHIGNLPIISNTTNTVVVVANSFAGTGAGVVYDIVRPLVTWTPDQQQVNSSSWDNSEREAILLQSGGNVVDGFVFDGGTDDWPPYCFVQSMNPSMTELYGPNANLLTRIRVARTDYPLAAGAGFGAFGVIFDGIFQPFGAVGGGAACGYSLITTSSPSSCFAEYGSFGLNLSALVVRGTVSFKDNNGLFFNQIDVRNGSFNLINTTAITSSGYISVEGAGSNPAIKLVGSSLANVSLSGSTGNTGVGLQLEKGSYFTRSLAYTLTGTGGDVKIGAAAAQTWASCPATDKAENIPQFCGVY